MAVPLNLLLVTALWITIVHSYDREMTVTVESGARECFFHTVEAGEIIDIEYQVIDGGHGDLDINFDISDPNKRILFADFKKPDNLHRHEAKLAGDYAFCFDNTFSKLNRKTVFFELIIEREGDEPRAEDLYQGLNPEEVYELKVQDIQDSIHVVKTHLTKARQVQDILRSYEARDRNLAEENNFKVNSWSIFQVFAMLVVGTVQVVMVRSLFDSESKVHQIWSKLTEMVR